MNLGVPPGILLRIFKNIFSQLRVIQKSTHRYVKPHSELGMCFVAGVLSKTGEWLSRTGTSVWRTVGRE